MKIILQTNIIFLNPLFLCIELKIIQKSNIEPTRDHVEFMDVSIEIICRLFKTFFMVDFGNHFA